MFCFFFKKKYWNDNFLDWLYQTELIHSTRELDHDIYWV